MNRIYEESPFSLLTAPFSSTWHQLSSTNDMETTNEDFSHSVDETEDSSMIARPLSQFIPLSADLNEDFNDDILTNNDMELVTLTGIFNRSCDNNPVDIFDECFEAKETAGTIRFPGRLVNAVLSGKGTKQYFSVTSRPRVTSNLTQQRTVRLVRPEDFLKTTAIPQRNSARRRFQRKVANLPNPNIQWSKHDLEFFDLVAAAFRARRVPEASHRLYLSVEGTVCPVCTRNVKSRNKLLDHILVHTNEKIFACPVAGCSYGSIKSSHMSGHLLRHTKARPYKCLEPGCGESVAKFCEYDYHYKTVHKKKPACIDKLWTPVMSKVDEQ